VVGLQLKLKQAQKQIMAPQLRQAIGLLQLNRQSLVEHIRQTVEENPLLDYVEPQPEPGEDFSSAPGAATDALEVALATTGTEESLAHHLLWQLQMEALPAHLDEAARVVIDALDADGYLRTPLTELATGAAAADTAIFDEALARVQQLDPPGVGARSLVECLKLQVLAAETSEDVRRLALALVEDYLEEIASGDLEALAQEVHTDPESLAAAIELIRGLDPHPGRSYDTSATEYIRPDVYARRTENGWSVTLSPDQQPPLQLNREYVELLRKRGNQQERDYLDGRLQEARWLMNALELRAHTLLSIAAALVKRQDAMLDQGPAAMRPLVMREVAEVIGVHTSTVSRAVARKYLQTPAGIWPLRQFFCNSVGGADSPVAAAAVKARLQHIIDDEDPARPHSDQALVEMLATHGIKLARRTVAKYRQQLGIADSRQRRK